MNRHEPLRLHGRDFTAQGECTNAWSVIHTRAPNTPATSPTRPVPLPSSSTFLPSKEPRWTM